MSRVVPRGISGVADLRLEVVDKERVGTTSKPRTPLGPAAYKAHLAGFPDRPVDLGFDD